MSYWILIFLLTGDAHAKTMKGFELKGALVPIFEIKDGGVPRDGIPALNKPKFLAAAKAQKIFSRSARAIIVENQGVRKAYPIPILNWHEVVNDEVGGKDLVVTFCPLCGTGMVFHADGRKFGVSGLLYESDVLLYDKKTQSLWSQIRRQAVTGKNKGRKLRLFRSQLISLHPYLKQHPDTLVLSNKTGFSRPYFRDPYRDYAKKKTLYFPVKHQMKEIHPKTWSIYIEGKKGSLIAPIHRLPSKPKANVTVGGQKVTLTVNQRRGEISCQGQEFTCFTGYFFALKTFYPDTPILKN